MRPVERWPEPFLERPTRIEPVPIVERRQNPLLHVVLFATTLVTTTIAGALNADVGFAEMASRWTEGLPFSLTLMSILLVHEMGHYVIARIHGVRSTLPYFLPAPPFPFLIGTFGAFIRMKSPPRDRRALFDVGAAGPWAGLAVAIPAVVLGLHLSEVHPIPPKFTGLYFGDSLLFMLLSRLVVGPVPYGFDVILHPVAMAGWFGLFVTLLNLLPVGQLDGGHVVYAMFGRGHRGVARAFLLLIVAFGFLGWQGWFLWAALLMFSGVDHPPTLDRDTPLDPRRRFAGWLTLAVFVVTFIPVPIRLVEGGAGPEPEDLVPVVFHPG
jgi:membrane-associated protease RseP (regulator of RpoE activity)